MNKAKSINYHKVCWQCGKETMQPHEKWFKCTNCGATYCDIPVYGRLTLTYRELPGNGGIESKPYGAP